MFGLMALGFANINLQSFGVLSFDGQRGSGRDCGALRGQNPLPCACSIGSRSFSGLGAWLGLGGNRLSSTTNHDRRLMGTCLLIVLHLCLDRKGLLEIEKI